MTRLENIPVDTLEGEAKDLFDRIVGGARGKDRPLSDFVNEDGGLRGPFNPLLYTPEIGNVSQALGEKIRFRSSLSDAVREIAILTVAAYWRADYEWFAHAKIARNIGVNEQILSTIKDQRAIPLEGDDAVLGKTQKFILELLERQRVSDETFDSAKESVGEAGVVELVLLFGYYTLISATLNTFEIPLPEGEVSPFDEG
ncbi:MAG: carboxymuconolactone decarboxylase family protein [Methyloligellaceae bacterium]